MKKIPMFLMTAGLALLFFAPVPANAQSGREYIPKGAVKADVMVLGSTSRLQELSAKIKQSVSQDLQWYKEYVNAAQPGVALAHHPKLGVTEAEYKEFLELSKTGFQMVKSEESPVDFKWISDSLVQISAGGTLADLNGIQIDLANNTVKTAFGVLATLSQVNNINPSSPTGIWTGIQWKLENVATGGGAVSGVVAKFALGRLASSGRGILYFNAKDVRPDGTGYKVDHVLYYDL